MFQQPTKNIFFPDQEEPIYDPSDQESMDIFRRYWQTEKDRCINGFSLADGKVKIPGFLYFHCVYWKIAMYVEVNDRKVRKIDTPILRDVDWDIINDFEKCEQEGKFYALVGSRDWGKELANYEPVMLANGNSKPIGECEVGDIVLGKDGQPTKITGVFPQGEKDIYELELLDGRKVHCGLDHLWQVEVGKKLKILSTRELLSTKIKHKHRRSGYTYKYFIPQIEEVVYPEKVLPIHPYILGALLGDGSLTNITPAICCEDKQIIDRFKELLPEYEIRTDLSYVANSGKNIKNTIVYRGEDKYKIDSCGANPLSREIAKLGLKTNSYSKFIPEEYKYSSIEQRYELIRGLMDTDGSVSTEGSIEFCTVSKKLAEDITFVLRGLGINCSITEDFNKVGKVQLMPQGTEFIAKNSHFRVHIKTDKEIFFLERKKRRLQKRKTKNSVAIKNISHIGKHEATCITVDNEDRMFLTRNYVPTHNSILGASRAGWLYTFFDNSESVISAGAESYIKLATDKIEDGLTNIHPIWKKQRIANDWKKEVRAGWKDNKTNQPDAASSNSRIIIRNYQEGNNTMAANGTRPGFHLIDEIGTLPNFISCLKDSDGCWWSGGGNKPSCLPMFAGTGGNAEVGAEAAEVFFNPEAYNILSFDNPEGPGKIGRFVSALRSRMAFKEQKTLADYLNIDHPDLKKIPILVSNEERAYNEWWLPQYEKAKKAGNPKTLIKFKAYWPLKPSDSFIVLSNNNYNTEAAKAQKAKLLSQDQRGTCVWLYHDGEHIRHKFTDKQPITEFPVKTQDTDAPVVIWEFPIENPPWGLYIAGIDNYRQDDGSHTDSLGAVYIYKRMHEISGEKFQDMFVASYVARPKTVDEWNEQARLLIKYYNAFSLAENDDMTFIRYMQNKGDDFYLSDQPAWLTDVVPNTTVNRPKGIHRSSEKVRNFLRTCLKRYLDDPIYQETDAQGRVIKETLGVSRVLDPMLLEEIIKFNAKEGNFDREVAASLAVALADKMAPIGKIGNRMSDPRYQSLFKPKEVNSNTLFSGRKPSLFSKTKTKLFH